MLVREGGHRSGRLHCDVFRKAEIQQLRARRRQHHVAWFQIAMDDALAVRVVERVGDLDGEAEHLFGRQRSPREAVIQCFALQILHDQELHALRLRRVGVRHDGVADVEQCADVRMAQRRNRARLGVEPRAASGPLGELGGEQFDRDRAFQARVAGLIDFAHSARADERDDLVRSKLCADR
jgi:hypothetical protein